MNRIYFYSRKFFHRVKVYLIANRSNPRLYLTIGLYLLLFSVFFINAFHEEYPDEFDNMLGGLFILKGSLPYRDFFTHHGSISYFLSAFISLFTGNSFVHFRIFYSIILFLATVGTYKLVQNKIGNVRSQFYPIFIVLLSVGSTYFWLQMLVADGLSAFLLTPVFAILILKAFYNIRLTTSDFILISTCTSLAFLNSLTYLFVACIIYAYVLYIYALQEKKAIFKMHALHPVILFAIPYLIYLIYLLVTGSITDFIYQTIIFNRKYYIYNLPEDDGQGFINPIRYAISIAYSFYNNFYNLLLQVRDFNLGHPVNVTLAVANTSALIYFALKRKIALLLFILGIMIFANVRSNPLTSAERDYQSAVYITLALFLLSFLFVRLYKELNNQIEWTKKLIYTGLFLLICIYGFFTSIFLTHRFFEKAYQKYMGKAPIIYNFADFAPIMNAAVGPDEYYLMWPFEFEEMIYMTHGKLPTKYHIFIPGMGNSPEIRAEMMADLTKTPPEVIWFDRRFFILGRSPEMYGKFFIEFLDKNYTTLYKYQGNGITITSVAPINGRVDIETKLYIRHDMVETVIQRLHTNGLIKIQ
jgi:hypothetical protein